MRPAARLATLCFAPRRAPPGTAAAAVLPFHACRRECSTPGSYPDDDRSPAGYSLSARCAAPPSSGPSAAAPYQCGSRPSPSLPVTNLAITCGPIEGGRTSPPPSHVGAIALEGGTRLERATLTRDPRWGRIAVGELFDGLNLGPNLALSGSLSAALWMRVATATGSQPSASTYFRLGLLLVPCSIAAGLVALTAFSPVGLPL
jgi:hypothetical protein